MIKKFIRAHGKSIITPTLTTAFLLLIPLVHAPEKANYFASFIAEILVILAVYYLSAREERALKKEMKDKSSEFNNLLDSEIKKAVEIVSMLGNGSNLEAEQAKKHLGDLMKEKSDLTQKTIRKSKEESEVIEGKYNKAVRDKQDAEQDMESRMNLFVKDNIE